LKPSNYEVLENVFYSNLTVYCQRYIVVSLSLYKCTYCKSLWTKASTKCPKSKCQFDNNHQTVACPRSSKSPPAGTTVQVGIRRPLRENANTSFVAIVPPLPHEEKVKKHNIISQPSTIYNSPKVSPHTEAAYSLGAGAGGGWVGCVGGVGGGGDGGVLCNNPLQA